MSNKIDTIIQNMAHDESRAHYFFSQASQYQKLHLWLEPLYMEKYFSFEGSNFEGHRLHFLESVAIQNKEDEKPEITNRLLLIASNAFKKTGINDRVAYSMVKIIFNLPKEKITIEHIGFIHSHIKKSRNIWYYDIEGIVLPVLIKHNMTEHLLKLLKVIFDYKLLPAYRGSSKKEITSSIGQHNLQELLERYSKDIIKQVKIEGLKVVVGLIKEIINKNESSFNTVWISTIRTKTKDEISQNQNLYRYDKQLIFFVRDLLESLPANKIKPYINNFLSKETHPIFTKLALHIINCKYDELKDIFWDWMNAKVKRRKSHEFWTFLDESSENFTNAQFDKIIDWIEGFDAKEYPDGSNEEIEKSNAYQRKDWLRCLKDSNLRAKVLYQKYNEINSEKSGRSWFDYWISTGFIPNQHPIDLEKLCENPIREITEFSNNPDRYGGHSGNPKNDVADDLLTCIKGDPERFAKEINDFGTLDYVYKNKLIQGFSDAWADKRDFNWGKVFDFILNELKNNSFEPNSLNVGEIARLIENGTRSDKNAFDKKLLPKAKKILFKLIDNKEDETGDVTMDWGTYVLNSNNGKVLHSLIIYSLRYGRLNSSQEIKWESEVKDFFTQQLDERTNYSKSIFTILGTYLNQLQFLDREWTKDNFNKIFPLSDEELWEISMSNYFFHTNQVYKNIYILLKEHKHIDKAIDFKFSSNETKNKIIDFVSIAYMNECDEETAMSVIKSNNKDNILSLIKSISRIYRNTKDVEVLNKIYDLWRNIYEQYKENKYAVNIFQELADWFIFIREINFNNMKWLKHTVKNFKEEQQNAYQVSKSLSILVKEFPEGVGKLYLEMVDNNVFLDDKKEHVKATMLAIKPKTTKTKIINKYILKKYD